MLTFFVLLSKYVIISSGDFMDRYALGNFLADLRNEKGLTQEQVATMINVNYKNISKWECGTALPGLDTLAKLATIYDVSLYEMSIYKRINNKLITKNDINKVVNEKGLKKLIIKKTIITIILTILLLITSYTYIYTINNYNQMQVYELISDDKNYDVKGLYVKTNDSYYISISNIDYIGQNNEFMNDITKELNYYISIDDKNETALKVVLDNETTIKNILPMLQLYISDKKQINNINDLYVTLYYQNHIKENVTRRIKIIFSEQISNNKLFY